MARPSLFALMRRNWKRSTFATVTVTGATLLFYDYTLTRDLMKANCQRAVALGDQRLKNPKAKTRHVTVIMNPVAGKRKSKKLYTKWVEPLLHLAGIKVSLIETDSPNQAYNLMKIMSDCDAVAVVGGDGTVHEVINGLLHRQDRARATRDLPIAILPTGQYNSIARYLHQGIHYRNQKELLVHSTMMLVNSVTEKHDVLEVKPLHQTTDTQSELPVYVLRDVRYGKYQDNFVKLSGYMFYQNSIKPWWLRFKNLFTSSNPLPQIESLSYSEPCAGCSRCIERYSLKSSSRPKEEDVQSSNRRWWSVVAPVPKKSPSEEELRELELSKRDNPNCDRFIKISDTASITDLRASMMGDRKIRLSLATDGRYSLDQVLEVQDVHLQVNADLEKAHQAALEATNSSQTSSEDQDSTSKEGAPTANSDKAEFLIDGQKSQVKSISITPIAKAVTIFTGHLKIV